MTECACQRDLPRLRQSGRNIFTSLPGRPLAAAIDRYAERIMKSQNRWFVEGGVRNPHIGAACERAEIADRDLFRWRTGECHPTLASADKVMTRLGLLWWDVWNEDTVRQPVLIVRTYRHAHHTGRDRRLFRRDHWYGDAGPDLFELERVRSLLEPDMEAEAA